MASSGVRLTIDGREAEVPRGTRVMLAADGLGIYIPRFCYHPQLEILGACRICLVQVFTPVLDRATGEPVLAPDTGEPVYRELPTLQTSCTLEVSEGMRVVTDSEKVRRGREAIIEFLLANHPLDCPVCDKGGECPLQEMTMLCGPARQRFEEQRIKRDKARRIGASIVLDQERCIVCFRCTRFLSEWADEKVFEFHERGDRNEIEPAFGQPIERARFAGNTIDLCPVGALTSEHYRFSARPWELGNTAGICPYCLVGCSITLGGRLGTLCRVTPGYNYAVNDSWLCDRGRYDYKWVNEGRLTEPLVRLGGELRPVSWPEALAAANDSLRTAENVAVVVEPSECCETGYMAQRLARGAIGSGLVYADDDYDLAGPFQGTIRDLLNQELVILVSADLLELAPVLWLRLNRRARGGRLRLVAVAPAGEANTQKRLAWAHAHLATGAEPRFLTGLTSLLAERSAATLTEVESATGVSWRWLEWLTRHLERAQRVGVIVGPVARADYVAARGALANLVKRLQATRKWPVPHGFVVGGANSRGLRVVGCARGVLPGWARPDDADARKRLAALWGRPVPAEQGPADWRQALIRGEIGGLVVVGGDPLRGAGADLAAAAKNLPALVYLGTNANETSAAASACLPAASFQEVPFTYVNFEGRLQRSEPTNEPIRSTVASYEILGRLAEGFGLVQEDLTVSGVRAEMTLASEVLADWCQHVPADGKLLRLGH